MTLSKSLIRLDELYSFGIRYLAKLVCGLSLIQTELNSLSCEVTVIIAD